MCFKRGNWKYCDFYIAQIWKRLKYAALNSVKDFIKVSQYENLSLV